MIKSVGGCPIVMSNVRHHLPVWEGDSLSKFLAPFAVLGAQAALVVEVTRSFGKVIKSLGWRLKFRRKMYLCVQKVT